MPNSRLQTSSALWPSKLGPAELDAQYNNRALVPEFAEHFANWQCWSEQARRVASSERRFHADLRYASGAGSLDDHGASLDVFASRSTKSVPVLFFIHGGYWRSLDKADHSFVADIWPNDVCSVVPNYALCPGTPTQPVTVAHISHQVALAYAWTVKHIADFGGDPSRIVVVGHSAGGHLTAMLMAAKLALLGLKPEHAVHRAFAVSGLFELQTIARTPYLRDSLRLTDAVATACSPAWMPCPASGQLVCVAGSNESAEFRRHNTLMQAAWGQKRVPQVYEEPGANHFTVLERLRDTSSCVHADVRAALMRR